MLTDGPLEITIHEGFDFWTEEEPADPDVAASLERANQSAYPTVRLDAARAAYWCQVPERAHLRWVLPDAEDAALAALARSARGGSAAAGRPDTASRGCSAPTAGWCRSGTSRARSPAAEWEPPLAEFVQRYDAALADPEPLDAAARRARQGLIGRQLTLR